MKRTKELFDQINKLSMRADSGNIEQLLTDDIHFLVINYETFSAIDSTKNINNFSFLVIYGWIMS